MKFFATLAFGLFFSLFCTAQNTYFVNAMTDDLGWSVIPDHEDSIAALEDYGGYDNLDEGYQVGDTVADFTVYNYDGESLTLSDELKGDKFTLLINGSITCSRFRQHFDTTYAVYAPGRQYVYDHLNDFNWVFIYGLEAHPSDGNCPSNCPPFETLDTAVTQGPDYGYRVNAMNFWQTHGEPYEFPFSMYADNPDNSVYNHFFRRPHGFLAVNCEGIVVLRADWASTFMLEDSFLLDQLLEEDFQQCEFDVVEGVHENNLRVNAFPNPASNQLQLDLPGTGIISLNDVNGVEVYRAIANGSHSVIDVSGFAPGCYAVRYESSEGMAIFTRILIQH